MKKFLTNVITKFWVRFMILMMTAMLGYFAVQAQKYPKPHKNGYKAEVEFTEKFEKHLENINGGVWIQYFYSNADIHYQFVSDSIIFYSAKIDGPVVKISQLYRHYWWVDKEIGNLHIGPLGNAKVWIPLGKLRYRSSNGYMILKLKRK